MNDITSEERFDKIDDQLERISTALIKGFDRINKTLETKANSADLQTALGYSIHSPNDRRFLMTNDSLWATS